MRVLRRIRSLVSTHAPQPTPADGSAVVARTDKKSIFTRALQGAVVLGAGLALTVGAAGLPQAAWATEDSAEAATEETAAAQTYTAQATSSDKSAKSADELPVVTVDAPKGALPEGAELHAELVESEKDTQAVADELEKAEVSYDGFLALDVYFADADGNEVEPAEPVDVRFELPEGALPEGAEDLAVHHLAEAEDGTVADVEAVADDADATEGTVAVQDDATVDAEFTVESFSTFTITWNESKDEEASVGAKAPEKPGDKLTTVDTVNSTAEGVHMYMRDFPGKAYTGGEYSPGDVKEGMSTKTVNKSGWPQLSNAVDAGYRGMSFAQLFFADGDLNAYDMGDKYAVNHLFLKSYYDEDGTFYYSSFDNFASLKNDGDDNFTVYNQLGTPKDDNQQQYFFQRGNFMPYNTLNTSRVLTYNLYDEYGQRLADNAPRYNENVYGFNEDNNYDFGMYVWADFYQPKDGKVESNDGESSKEMIFEFTGDDDMWVYIDGVLVLDLGGIHDAQSGSINFATGEVRFTDTKTNNAPVWKSTTIKAQYEAAGKANSYNWKGDTYADGSSHRIQIFYMERGHGASNLKISFNLKTIPDGNLTVRKDVENYYAPQVADIEYTMEVTVNGEKYAKKPYTILGDDEVHKTDENGRFKLRHDQTAMFSELQVGDKVSVKEVGASDTDQGAEISDNYDISYTVTDSAGHTHTGDGEDGAITAEMPGYGSINVTVGNKATYTRPLKLVKNFEGTEGNKVPEDFEATYTLYEVDKDGGKTEIGSVKYSDFEDGEYVFWLDTGKNYTVVETFGAGDNNGGTESTPWTEVVTTTNDPASGTEASAGVVHLDENDATLENATDENPVDTIALTNVYGQKVTLTGTLQVFKHLDGASLEQNEFSFTVKAIGQESAEKANSVEEGLFKPESGYTHAYTNTSASETDPVRNGVGLVFTEKDVNNTYTYEYRELDELWKAYDGTHKAGQFVFDSSAYRAVIEVTDPKGVLTVTIKIQEEASDGLWQDVEGKSVTYTKDGIQGSSDPLSITFENKYRPYGLDIYKGELGKDKNGEPVADPNSPLAGAEFTLATSSQFEDGSLVGTLETGEDGHLRFDHLAAGTYYLKETKAPAGYQLLTAVITVEITDDGNATFSMGEGDQLESTTVEVSEDGYFHFSVANKPYPKLPSSGSSGTVLMSGVGAAAIIVAGAWLLMQRGIDLVKFTSR